MNKKFLPNAVLFIIAFIAGNSSAQTVTGSGTAGRIPVWTGQTTLGNSIITQSAGKIGIGTAAPGGTLGVAATSGIGVYGLSNTSIGVAGISNGSVGVAGYSPTSYGVLGLSVDRPGVYGSASGAGDAVYGSANTGYGGFFSSATNDAADFQGNDRGIFVNNHGSNPAIESIAHGSNSYGGSFTSDAYRGGYFKSNSNVLYSLFVDTQDGPTQATAGLNVRGTIRGEGNLVIAGSKAGYVVDEMQNADSVNLEAGDVVVIAEDSSAPVLGQIPVPRIKLAANANDTAVVGVVDQIMHVPDAATRAAYEAQETADRDAAAQAKNAPGNKQESITNIRNRISDEAGTLHPDSYATSARPGGYCSVVTLGAYKAVKADANFGAIHAGDLLTTSSHAGYAMRVNDKAAASGAIIGKALSSLASGTGSVTVMVTLK